MAKAPEALQRVADQFTRQLLGRVIAAERIEDLDLCERGITRDGIYKQAPTRRRLRQLAGFEFTLGTEGLKRLLAALTREQQGLMARRAAIVCRTAGWMQKSMSMSQNSKALSHPGMSERARLAIGLRGQPSRLKRLEKIEIITADH